MSTGLDEQVMFGPEGVGPGNNAQVDAVRNLLGLAGTSLALGAGVRGLSGLGSFFGRNVSGAPKTPQRQTFVRIPVPVKVRSRAERDAMLAAAVEAQDKEAGFVKLADWAKTIADTAGLLRRPGQIPNLLQEHLGGWGQTDMSKMPWVYPTATLGALGGGLYGGWKLTDLLLDKTKNMEQESELEAARQEYEKALAGRRKIASAEAKPSPLDELADRYEKRALLSELTGTGLALAGGTALLSGIGTYNWARSLSEEKAVEEAVRRRQAQIAEQAPSPIMAIPTPVPVYNPPRKSHFDQALEHGQQLASQGQQLAGHGQRWLMGEGGQKWLLGQSRKKKKPTVKVANIGQAADQFLSRIKNNQMAVWQRMMTPADAKPAKPAAPAEPAPPQLPTLAGTRTRMMGQQST